MNIILFVINVLSTIYYFLVCNELIGDFLYLEVCTISYIRMIVSILIMLSITGFDTNKRKTKARLHIYTMIFSVLIIILNPGETVYYIKYLNTVHRLGLLAAYLSYLFSDVKEDVDEYIKRIRPYINIAVKDIFSLKKDD